jgi:hypothetical protein
MAFTEEDLDALDEALKSGVRRVQYRDRTVEYQSIKDMIAARNVIKDEIEPTTPAPKRNRIFRLFQSGRG